MYGISNSQEYIPMLNDSNKWSVDVFYCPFTDEPPYTWTVTQQISINGTVNINGLTYKQIYKDDNPSCLLREEKGVVYKYYENDNNERILFDFNAEIGDEFFMPDLAFGSYYCSGTDTNVGTWYIEVSSIDYLFIAGAERKVINFIDPWYPNSGDVMYWIEGIGTTAGLGHSWPFQDITCGSRLACHETNGVNHFMYGATSCDNTTPLSINNFETIENIIVYPNPVNDISILQLPFEAEIDQLVIYDVRGRIIKNEIITKEYYRLNAMNFASGIYLYQVLSKGNIIKANQFIVK